MAFSVSVLRFMPDIAKQYDAVIVGAGLAGSAAAIHLARAGKSVCLVEKTIVVHHKVCGEFLSHEAVSYLCDLGLDVRAIGAVPITHMRLIKGAHIAQAPLLFQAYSVSRHALDEALIAFAIAAGATVERGVNITEISNGDYWQVSGGAFTAHGNALFLSTGKHDVKGWHRQNGVKNDYIGFKMHYQLDEKARNILDGHTDVILFRGGYAGLQLIENGYANFCLVIEKRRFKEFQSDWSDFVSDLIQATPHLKDILSKAKPCWDKPLAIYGIPYGYVYQPAENTSKNIYRLGDQMAVIPSFAGGGMAIALHTAKLATACYLGNDTKYYNQKAAADLKPHVQKSTRLGMIMASRMGQTTLVMISRLFPILLTKTANFTRLVSL